MPHLATDPSPTLQWRSTRSAMHRGFPAAAMVAPCLISAPPAKGPLPLPPQVQNPGPGTPCRCLFILPQQRCLQASPRASALADTYPIGPNGMKTRSGIDYSALNSAPKIAPTTASSPKIFKTSLATRDLLQAAVGREDARHSKGDDDSEGAALVYGAGGMSDAEPIRMQARDLALTAASRAGDGGREKPTPPPESSGAGGIERKRKRSQSNLRKKKKRATAAKAGAYGRPGLPIAAHRRFDKLATTHLTFDSADAPPAGEGAYVGKRVTPSKKVPWEVDELIEQEGFGYKKWNGRDPELLTGKEKFCSVILAGQPDDWGAVSASATREMAEVRDEGLASGAFKSTDADHRRGKFLAFALGISYGGGQTRPGNLTHSPEARSLIDRLIANDGVRRIASFQNNSLAYYAPKVYDYTRRTLKELYDHDPWLQPNFDKSIYPAVTFNCGPETACLEHTDAGNAAHLLCAITALGNYDPTQGGHLIIFPLKLIIEFPPGSTILIPSATIAHGNTPIMAGESRMSMTQYCAGGLFRWVDYGFRSAKSLLATKGGAQEKAKIDVPRAAMAINLFSKSSELAADRDELFKKA